MIQIPGQLTRPRFHSKRMADQPCEIDTNVARRLRGVILLAGSIRPSSWLKAIGRAPLDLPVDQERCLLNHWVGQVGALADACGLSRLPLHIAVNERSYAPKTQTDDAASAGQVPVIVEQDQSEWRGTGGLLRDLMARYEPDDYVVVANAAQLLLWPLPMIVHKLAESKAAMALVAHVDGTVSGVLLMRCGVMGAVRGRGFVDLKEQALGIIGQNHRVVSVQWDEPSALPIRNHMDYVGVLRQYHQPADFRGHGAGTVLETWHASYAIVEPGATVHPSARIHDSVVLAGGVVGENAVVVRSVVTPGGTVGRGGMAVDTLVDANGVGRKRRM